MATIAKHSSSSSNWPDHECDHGVRGQHSPIAAMRESLTASACVPQRAERDPSRGIPSRFEKVTNYSSISCSPRTARQLYQMKHSGPQADDDLMHSHSRIMFATHCARSRRANGPTRRLSNSLHPCNHIDGNKSDAILRCKQYSAWKPRIMLRQSGGIWVEGDRFCGRVAELASLTERVNQGRHTLLTAQRRMGKTSLIRELLTEAAINGGRIDIDSISAFKTSLKLDPIGAEESVQQVLRVLEHDGYLAYQDGEYRYVSGLLEDWWRKCHGRLSGPSRGRS